METPYNGRAIIFETLHELEITIPSKKKWFDLIFLLIWLIFWAIIEFLSIAILNGHMFHSLDFAKVFLVFWLCGWTLGGFYALKNLIWYLIGKEVISFHQGQLTISKKASLLSNSKTYDLKEVKKLRILEEKITGRGQRSLEDWGSMDSSNGTIRFDYGMKTTSFVNGIDDAESNYILEKLKKKRLITEENL